MTVKKQNLRVCVSSTISPLVYMQMSRSQQAEEIHKEMKAVYLRVSSLAEASDFCRRHIEKYNLGSSNWTGGRVINDNAEFVACVSYNGRVWDSEEYDNAKEIII